MTDEIRETIRARAAAVSSGDVKTLITLYDHSAVEYTLAPPLRQETAADDPEPTERWIATFEAPPQIEVTQLEITASADVAFATSIDSMTAVPKGASESFTLWYRSTVGLRRIDGRWLITHEHHSVPFEMDGSLRASVNLTP